MKNKIYNPSHKLVVINQEEYSIPDYFQYYTTGAETIPTDDQLIVTSRRANERYEILANDIFSNPNLADLLVAINNDVLLWNTPLDYDLLDLQGEILYDYVKKIYKTNFESPEKWKEIIDQKVLDDDEKYRVVLIPKQESIQKVIRKIKEYFEEREVK